MNKTATSGSTADYSIRYGHATWVSLDTTVGVFVSIVLNSPQDEILSSEFIPGTDGTDSLKLGINRGEGYEPIVRSFVVYPLNPGTCKDECSKMVEISVEDAATGERLCVSRLAVYGQGSWQPTRMPQDMYEFSYLSAPFAVFLGQGQENNQVYFIINTLVTAQNEIKPVFTPAPPEMQGDIYDTFVLDITGPEEGETLPLRQVYGPYTLANRASTRAVVSSTINGRPAQKPIGIKSYGNEIY